MAMTVYITDSGIPELARLSPEVARAVMRRANDRMHSESKVLSWLPTILCILGIPVGSLFGGWLGFVFGIGVVAFGPGRTSFLCIPGMMAGGLVAGFIGKQIQFPKLRGYIRETITDFARRA